MDTRAALRYAKAILNLAEEQKAEAAVNTDMETIAATIAESEELSTLVSSPVVKASDKVAAIKAVFPKLNNLTVGLVNLLGENKRLSILATVAQQYAILFDELQAKKVAVVITAVPLTAELENKIKAKVKELTGKESALQSKVDPSIIGGFVLRIGDLQYDASVANNLNELERSFENGHYTAKI